MISARSENKKIVANMAIPSTALDTKKPRHRETDMVEKVTISAPCAWLGKRHFL
jgi:hypothetical protein